MYAKIYVYLKIVRCSNRMYHGGIFVLIWNTIGETCSKYSHTQQGCVNTSELICASQICEMPNNTAPHRTAHHGFANSTVLHIYWIVSHLHLLFCRVHSRNLLYHMVVHINFVFSCKYADLTSERARSFNLCLWKMWPNICSCAPIFHTAITFVKEKDVDCERKII